VKETHHLLKVGSGLAFTTPRLLGALTMEVLACPNVTLALNPYSDDGSADRAGAAADELGGIRNDMVSEYEKWWRL